MSTILKKFIDSICNLLTFCLRLISFHSIIYLFKNFYRKIYTKYISQSFGNIGRNPFIYPYISLMGSEYIHIGDNFHCYGFQRIEAYDKHLALNFSPKIIIGNNVSINPYCHIGAINCIKIGDNVLIASRVFITDHYHGEISSSELNIPPSKRNLFSKGPVIIEKNVWVGEGVVILPGVTIGENCIIGANAVVTKSFPKNSIIAGNPAKIVKSINQHE